MNPFKEASDRAEKLIAEQTAEIERLQDLLKDAIDSLKHFKHFQTAENLRRAMKKARPRI